LKSKQALVYFQSRFDFVYIEVIYEDDFNLNQVSSTIDTLWYWNMNLANAFNSTLAIKNLHILRGNFLTMMLFTPMRQKLDKLKKCNRCFLCYEKKLDKCPHCSDLDKEEVKKLIEMHHDVQVSNSSLGKYFVIISIFIISLLISTLI